MLKNHDEHLHFILESISFFDELFFSQMQMVNTEDDIEINHVEIFNITWKTNKQEIQKIVLNN